MQNNGYFYVNSFPRSGNTWVRNIFNIILSPNNIDVNPKFYNVFNFINFHKIPKVNLNGKNGLKMTMIKSHGRYETTMDNIPIIYLVRDGRDAIISYYHFNVDHRGYVETFDQYFHRHVVSNKMNSYREQLLLKFMGDWSENVLSYLNKKNVMIIRYEDLMLEPVASFETMLKFIGANVDSKAIENALELGRRQLKEKNERHDRPRGVSGNWRERMSPAQQELFTNRHQRVIEMFGYGTVITEQNSR